MKNIILSMILLILLWSCSSDNSIIDRAQGQWNLQYTEGPDGNNILTMPWTVLIIEDHLFTLSDNKEEDIKEIANGQLIPCDNAILNNCFTFEFEQKNTDAQMDLEINTSKILRFNNGKFSVEGIHNMEVSYFFE